MTKRYIFWITSGWVQTDPYRVIINTDDIIRCNHCSKKLQGGFKGMGKFNTYQVCKSCLYNPSRNMIVHHFITIKENDIEFKRFLDRCENKTDYENLKKVITV